MFGLIAIHTTEVVVGPPRNAGEGREVGAVTSISMIGTSGGVDPFSGADLLEEARNRGGFIVSIAPLIGLHNDEEEECGKDWRGRRPGGKAPAPGKPATEGGGQSDDGAG